MTIYADPLNLIVCGVGGQGNILISRMIGRILSRKGYYVTIGETFGAAQRGGAVHSSMRISKKRYYGPLIPRGKAHIIASLEPLETLRILAAYGNENVMTVTNTQPVYPVAVLSRRREYPDMVMLKKTVERLSQAAWLVNVTQMALDLGAPIIANIILLGGLLGIGKVPLSSAEVEEEIRSTFPAPAAELNLTALEMGRKAILSLAPASKIGATLRKPHA
ncbi:MAG: 2-oxoacid:acceptor oxidoreductase family protein [Desulfomonilaceae bacterium]